MLNEYPPGKLEFGVISFGCTEMSHRGRRITEEGTEVVEPVTAFWNNCWAKGAEGSRWGLLSARGVGGVILYKGTQPAQGDLMRKSLELIS